MKTIKAFQCSFCGYYKKTKMSVFVHEKTCYYDPANKACASCSENIFREDHLETDTEVTNNYCRKRKIFLLKRNLKYNCTLWENKNKE